MYRCHPQTAAARRADPRRRNRRRCGSFRRPSASTPAFDPTRRLFRQRPRRRRHPRCRLLPGLDRPADRGRGDRARLRGPDRGERNRAARPDQPGRRVRRRGDALPRRHPRGAGDGRAGAAGERRAHLRLRGAAYASPRPGYPSRGGQPTEHHRRSARARNAHEIASRRRSIPTPSRRITSRSRSPPVCSRRPRWRGMTRSATCATLDRWRERLASSTTARPAVRRHRPSPPARRARPITTMRYGSDRGHREADLSPRHGRGQPAHAAARRRDVRRLLRARRQLPSIPPGCTRAGRASACSASGCASRGVREQVVILDKGAHTPFCTPERLLAGSCWRASSACRWTTSTSTCCTATTPPCRSGEFIDVLNEHAARGADARSSAASNWSHRADRGGERLRPAHRAARLLRRQQQLQPRADGRARLGGLHRRVGCGIPRLAHRDADAAAAVVQPGARLLHRPRPARRYRRPRTGALLVQRRTTSRARSGSSEMAKERGVLPINIALAYVLCQPFPTFALFGPRTLRRDAHLAPGAGDLPHTGRVALAQHGRLMTLRTYAVGEDFLFGGTGFQPVVARMLPMLPGEGTRTTANLRHRAFPLELWKANDPFGNTIPILP